MTNHNYNRGSARERQLKKTLEADGWVVIKAAGSKGAIDLICLRADATPLAIQVKSGIGNRWNGFGPDARRQLKWTAHQAGADPWFVRIEPNRAPAWYPPSQWPKSSKPERGEL